jgi:hypothetical protein
MATQGISFDNSQYLDVLNGLKSLPKSASRDMRAEAAKIADNIMVPAIKRAITSFTNNYARKLNNSVKTRQDRIPSVRVGNSNRAGYSGGANTNMLRFGTIKGQYQARGGKTQFWAEGIRPGWTDQASDDYYEPAFAAWTVAADKLVNNWNRGSDY